jgi:hypothetical protein
MVFHNAQMYVVSRRNTLRHHSAALLQSSDCPLLSGGTEHVTHDGLLDVPAGLHACGERGQGVDPRVDSHGLEALLLIARSYLEGELDARFGDRIALQELAFPLKPSWRTRDS